MRRATDIKPGKCLGLTLSELTGAAPLLFVQYFGRCERRPVTVQAPDRQPSLADQDQSFPTSFRWIFKRMTASERHAVVL